MKTDKKTPSLYALIHIGPTGFNDVELEFVDELPEDADKAYYTRGEGQCLIFKLDKYDMSTNFHKAFLAGIVTEELKGLHHPVKLIGKSYWKRDDDKIGYSVGYQPTPHKFVFFDYTYEERNERWTNISLEKYLKYKRKQAKNEIS